MTTLQSPILSDLMELMVLLYVVLCLGWMVQQGHLELMLLGGSDYAHLSAHTLLTSVMPSLV